MLGWCDAFADALGTPLGGELGIWDNWPWRTLEIEGGITWDGGTVILIVPLIGIIEDISLTTVRCTCGMVLKE
jgi:hypothetical protein